jgi:hypothetical protein
LKALTELQRWRISSNMKSLLEIEEAIILPANSCCRDAAVVLQPCCSGAATLLQRCCSGAAAAHFSRATTLIACQHSIIFCGGRQ